MKNTEYVKDESCPSTLWSQTFKVLQVTDDDIEVLDTFFIHFQVSRTMYDWLLDLVFVLMVHHIFKIFVTAYV